MKKLGSIVIVGLILIAPLAAKIEISEPLTYTENDAMRGETIVRGFYLEQKVPYRYLQMIIKQSPAQEYTYRLGFVLTGDYTSLLNGIILNIDGERIILRTKENSVEVNGSKLEYSLGFNVDRATFEKIAGAKKLLEFTAMIDDKYFTPTTVNGKDLTNFTQQVARIISDEELPALY